MHPCFGQNALGPIPSGSKKKQSGIRRRKSKWRKKVSRSRRFHRNFRPADLAALVKATQPSIEFSHPTHLPSQREPRNYP